MSSVVTDRLESPATGPESWHVRESRQWTRLQRPTRALEDSQPMPWGQFLIRPLVRLFGRLALARFRRFGGTSVHSIFDVRHVAVVHWENLGDAVLLGPVLRELRRNLPTSRIVLVFNEKNSEVFACCPYVDVLCPQVVQMPNLGGSPHGSPLGHRRKALDTARLLAKEARTNGPIDLLIGPDWLDPVYGVSFFDSALFRLGGGHQLLESLWGGKGPKIEIQQHHVTRNLDIIRSLGAHIEEDHLEFWTTREDEVHAAGLTTGLESDQPVVVLALGAGVPRRQWPSLRFAQLADELRLRLGAQVVLVGGTDAIGAAEGVKKHCHGTVVDLVGRTSVGVLAEILRCSDLAICNDSGPAHVAAAVGTAVVVVSTHPLDGEPWVVNSPNRYRPWGVPNVVVQPLERLESCRNQRTCLAEEAHCILSISVDDVVSAAVRLLADGEFEKK
jgi:ADP-heptose:LPS heptosyltransferase